MFIILTFLFIFSKLLNIYISLELYNNIDDYVVVYNYFKNISKSSISLFIISSNPLLSKFFFLGMTASASRLPSLPALKKNKASA